MFTLFFKDDWSTIYRLILCIFKKNKDNILWEDCEGQISVNLKKNYGMCTSVALDPEHAKKSAEYWNE